MTKPIDAEGNLLTLPPYMLAQCRALEALELYRRKAPSDAEAVSMLLHDIAVYVVSMGG